MEPTIFMAVLIDLDTPGGYWTERDREERDFRAWSKVAPRHLSFHTSEEGAKAALLAAARQVWEDDECSYTFGPWDDDDEKMLAFLNRHAGYEAHVTEQPVHIDGGAAAQAIADAAREAFGDDVELVFHDGACDDGPAVVTGVTEAVDAQVRAAEVDR